LKIAVIEDRLTIYLLLAISHLKNADLN
jgi:hypothetical protein